jgi:hypothetical protein
MYSCDYLYSRPNLSSLATSKDSFTENITEFDFPRIDIRDSVSQLNKNFDRDAEFVPCQNSIFEISSRPCPIIKVEEAAPILCHPIFVDEVQCPGPLQLNVTETEILTSDPDSHYEIDLQKQNKFARFHI